MTLKKPKKLQRKEKAVVIGCVVLAAVIILLILLSAQREASYYDFGKDVAVGYDLSEHNGDIDFDTLKSEVDFVFIRVGYRGYGTGKICEDKNARENLKAARKAGIPCGVYFYSQAVNEDEAAEEASFMLKIIRRYKIELPAVIDFEYPYDDDGEKTGRLWEASLSSSECTSIINAFCAKVEKRGYMPGVYASSSLFDSSIKAKKLGKNTVIWVADYNESVTYDVKYHIWQYSKTGQSDCVESKYVDLNYWYAEKQS